MLHVYVKQCSSNSLLPPTVHTQPQLHEKEKAAQMTFYPPFSLKKKKIIIILWHSALAPTIETLKTAQAASLIFFKFSRCPAEELRIHLVLSLDTK